MESGAPQRRDSERAQSIAVIASVLLHVAVAGVAYLAPRDQPPPPKSKPIEISVVEKPAPKPAPPPPAPVRAPPRPKRVAKPDAPKPTAPVLGPVTPAAPEPEIADAEPPPLGPAAPRVESKPSTTQPDVDRARGVKLFDPSALGMAVSRWKATTPGPVDSLPSGDPDGDAREHDRVSKRVGAAVAQALGQGRVSGGLANACDDGLDNNIDGEIDCADEGCRQLAVCSRTGVYFDAPFAAIPEDGSSLEREIAVSQEGRVRKFSVRINLEHGSKGDLAIELVSPTGEKAILRRADRDDPHFGKGFYVAEFVTLPAAGRYRLVVRDEVGGISGRLLAWELYVTS